MMSAALHQILAVIQSSGAVERVGWLLIHSLWQFAACALLAWALDRLLRRHSASLRYGMLLSAMLLVVMAPVATWWKLPCADSVEVVTARTRSPAPALALDSSTADTPLPADSIEPASSSEPRGDAVVMPSLSTSVTSTVSSEPASPAESEPLASRWGAIVGPWLSTIVVVWCFGVLLFSVRPVWSWFVVRRLRTVGVTPASSAIKQALTRLCNRLSVTRRVQVLESQLASAPVVVGCFRSVILLPASFISSVPITQLEAILAHELAHVQRYDYFVNLLQTLVETLFFYHPAVWWLSHRIRVERENCCDDLVVTALGNNVEYGRALLAVAEFRSASASPLALGARDGSLLARVKRVLSSPTRDDQHSSAGLAALGILFAGIIATVLWSAGLADAGTSVADEVRVTRPFRLPDHWIVNDVRFVSGDKQLMTVSTHGGVNVRRWDLAERQLVSEIKLAADEHGRSFRQDTLQLSPDGRRVIAATDDYVGVWDAATGELLKQLPIPTKPWEYDSVRCLDCSQDGSIIVAGLGTNYTRTTLVYDSHGIAWDADSGEVLCTFDQKAGYELCDIAVTPDGTKFATCSEGHRVCLWEARSGRLLHDYSQFAQDWTSPDPELIKNNLVRGIDLTPDAKQLAIAGTFGVKLIDVTSGELQRTVVAPYRYGIADVVFSADGRRIARFGVRPSTDADDTVSIWSADSGEHLFDFVASANIVSFSQDGQLLAIGESDFYAALSIWPLIGDTQQGPLPPLKNISDVNRVEENTHRRGQSAQKYVDRWQPVWGPTQHGLQYGIALTTAGNVFRAGERVLLAAFVRNTSDKPLKIDFRPDMFGNLPHVTDAQGTSISIANRPLLGGISHYRDTLQPGESFGPLYLNFGLGENPRLGRQNWYPYWPEPAPGRYQLTHRISISTADPSATGDASGPAWQADELTTGTLTYKVASADGAATKSTDANGQDDPPDTQASASDTPANWLRALADKTSVSLLQKLLDRSDRTQSEIVELPYDNRRGPGAGDGGPVKTISTASGTFCVVLAKVLPPNESEFNSLEQDTLPEAAFVFNANGKLIARLGGELHRGDRRFDSDDVDVVSLGPNEDWFVRVMNFEYGVEPFTYRSTYYRLADPVIQSVRFLHYANTLAWSNGPEEVERWGELMFDNPDAKSRQIWKLTGVNERGIRLQAKLIWDGDHNQFVGPKTLSAGKTALFQVDTEWSQEFKPLRIRTGQAAIHGGARSVDHWHAWQFVIPRGYESTAELNFVDNDGSTQRIGNIPTTMP